MRKAKPRDLLKLTLKEIETCPLTQDEQGVLLILFQASAKLLQMTERLVDAKNKELERLRQFEWDHTDHDYAHGC